MTAPKRMATSTARNAQMPADTRSKRGHGAKSQATRERAVLALLSEKTITDAAKKTGVDDSTLRRWLSQAEYAAARNAAYQAGIHRAQALTGRAMDTLEELLDAKINANVRLGAAPPAASVSTPGHP